MKTIKLLGLIIIILLSHKGNGQTSYKYYVSLKNYTTVPDNFSKSDLLNVINGIYNSTTLYNNVNTSVSLVRRAFKNAKTPILKTSIYFESTNPNLAIEFNTFSNYFEQASIIQTQYPCYTPNDFSITNNIRIDSLTSVNGVRINQYDTLYPVAQLDLIKAKQAWDITRGHPKIRVGICDWSLQQNHADLQPSLELFIGPTKPLQFHGTSVSGCAVAKSNNSIGIASIAGEKCKFVFAENDNTYETCLLLSQQARVRVINYSFGGGFDSRFLATVNEIVDSNNVVFISAPGNGPAWASGFFGDTEYVYPGAYANAFCVTSIGCHDPVGSSKRHKGYLQNINWRDVHLMKLSPPYSHHHNTLVDICAPGYLTFSTVDVWLQNESNYGTSDGTSFAAPIVAGVCALVASVNPCLTAQQIRNIVQTTADASIYNIQQNQQFAGRLGTGRVDAYQAVKRALELGTNFQQNITYNSNHVIWGATKIMAGRNVTTGTQGDVIVNGNSNVRYDANIEVELDNGFEVKGGNFEIRIIDSPCY